METVKIILISLQALAVLTNLLGLPGGMAAAVFPLIMFLSGYISVKLFVVVLFIIACGEFMEFYSGYVVGKKYGVSTSGFWVSVICAIALGIIMAPLFFGLGAVIGTFVGAYAGTMAYELAIGTTPIRAREKAKGVLFGRFLGTFAKIGAGFFAIYLEVSNIF